ncbi:hypothetical protein, partial [Candidatus Sororendozoicomonas aggregata]|uniref:hypothetical protein n=1 Tax=Candidatus Sororendozoicomonas aggregata TaxID=3073239 RepID=UPI002ED0E353
SLYPLLGISLVSQERLQAVLGIKLLLVLGSAKMIMKSTISKSLWMKSLEERILYLIPYGKKNMLHRMMQIH